MRQLIQFWYVQSYSWFYSRYLATVAGFETQIAVRDTLKNLTKPLFQDYTVAGHVIGFFFRIFRALLGIILYSFLAVLYLALYIFWLVLPFLFISSLIGLIAGTSPSDAGTYYPQI